MAQGWVAKPIIYLIMTYHLASFLPQLLGIQIELISGGYANKKK